MYAVQTADSSDLAELGDAARDGRAAAVSRRRALAAGRSALGQADERVRSGFRQAEVRAPEAGGNGAAPANGRAGGGAPVATNGTDQAHTGAAVATNGAAVATNGGPVATDPLASAHLGRTLSRERRRQMSQGKGALTAGAGQTAAAAANGAGAPGGAANGAAPPPSGGQVAPSGPALPADGLASAHLGRALSMERRRQLSQGKGALTTGAGQTAAAAAGATPALDTGHVDAAVSGRDQARARRAEASRYGSAGSSRPQREGRVSHAPKVVVSPTHGGQRVTGLRIGPGVRVTGDEAGASLPVSGSQYVAADGAAPAPGAGRKVGHVRTPQGLLVSGTTVRNKVAITGDEFGEHLPITGEADQKFDDDLTPRSEGAYRSTQFPRRADPHGATAVGTRLGPPGMVPSSGEGAWYPLETTLGGLAVTGTGVGRSGRVTGNEAGACRPITGDQYQGLTSSECGGVGGGTAPAAHLNRPRLDPVTGGKVTVAQTWGGQLVTGPSVEHHPSVTGDEPGVCRPVTGTPYQGPSTAFGWCEPDEGELAGRRLDARPHGVAVTGDVPMHAKGVTGTDRGHRNNVTGTPYYSDLRAAEPAADDWTGQKAFPVALARRLAGDESEEGAPAQRDDQELPASNQAGRITGSFASGEGKVTGNNEFLFRPRQKRDSAPPAVTGEGRTEGRTITGSPAAWKSHDRVTGTEGYIAAGRNPSEGGGGPHGWAGAGRFRDRATPGGPRQNVTGLSGWSAKAAARVTLSGGAQG